MRKKSEEFTKLQEWGETMLTFISESPYFDEDYSKEYRQIFDKCVEIGRLREMRMFIGDTKEMLQGIESKYLIKLNQILMEKFGEDLMSGMAKRMAGVLTRGKIRNDDEFVRVNEWIDHLLWDKGNPDAEQQIEQYNQLLRDYEAKAARRLKKSNPD